MTEVRINAERKSRETAEANAKLANASNGTALANEQIQKASGEVKAVGAWSASELDAMLGGDGSIQERTANAAEETVRQQKETNKQLKQMAKNTTGNSWILAYN